MNKVALVTGGTRGIGLGISRALAAEGFDLALNGIRGEQEVQEVLDELAGTGSEVIYCRGNLADPDERISIWMQALKQFGRINLLVNNAGITRDQILMRMKDEDWDIILETNLRSVFRLSKACLRGMMKARGGRIISIASVVGSMGNAGQSNYAAAKAGMMGFSRSLAREIGSRGITVNVVAPGFIDTDMTRGLDEQQRGALLRDIPLQRLGAPGDIAAAVLFLASEQGGYITGQTLHVNGGMYMA